MVAVIGCPNCYAPLLCPCLCCSANNNALKGKRKTINVTDVFNALEDMEFDSFVDPLKADLEGKHLRISLIKYLTE